MPRGYKSSLTFLIVSAVLLASASIPCSAEEHKGEFGFLIGGAGTADTLAGRSNDWDVAPVFGARGGFMICDHWNWFVDGTRVRFHTNVAPGDAEVFSLRSGVEWFVLPNLKTPWFVSGGVGWMSGNLQKLPVSGEDISFDRAFASVGFGGRKPISGGFVRWELRGDRSIGANGLNAEAVTIVQGLVGAAWGFGGAPRDTDADGVIDRKDKCPDTPRGAQVDQRGCPIDTDGDGVFDGLDRCPDTPKGWGVDAQGCPLDSDGDGVPDGSDKCPNTPKGAKVDANGCPIDSDGDGVFDGIDRCPATPRGAKVDAQGCPLDSDGDGVYDGLDKCPGTPLGTKVDVTGCPLPEPKAPQLFEGTKQSVILEGVNFETDKADLTAGSSVTLDKVADSLKDWPDVKVQIDGHTDSTGGTKHNQTLSEARAESVKSYLVGKGIEASRLSTKGFGLANPIADNKTKEGKAKNRRVEIDKVQ